MAARTGIFKTTRQFSFYMTPEDERRLDELRRKEHDCPARNEMLRRLLKWAEAAAGGPELIGEATEEKGAQRG